MCEKFPWYFFAYIYYYMNYNIKYDLGLMLTKEVDKPINTPYWYPFMSETAYWESLHKDMRFDIPYVLSDKRD